ncbi:GGDEF domain-containing protein [Nitratireductor sp. GISD-1A_MAKvit]|uniref:GGDEF domain-containing protein n=1 Tax=Nitratireductor sp. GISD-1A_MAKvit TaxID=3234198 RepID=UPI003467064F
MDRSMPEKTPRWVWLIMFTLSGTFAAIALSALIQYLVSPPGGIGSGWSHVLAVVAPPALTALPLLAYIGHNWEKTRNLRNEHKFISTHDPVTGVFNGRTFTSMVESRRSTAVSEGGRTFGALLIVEVENAREINIDYGFDLGDRTMRDIASVIRASVRRSDVVGRLNETEFGVFLPGATVEQARNVGERIREAVARAPFIAEEDADALSVDIGGVIFEEQIEFRGLMRIAWEQLEMAHQTERDRFRLSALNAIESTENGESRE